MADYPDHYDPDLHAWVSEPLRWSPVNWIALAMAFAFAVGVVVIALGG